MHEHDFEMWVRNTVFLSLWNKNAIACDTLIIFLHLFSEFSEPQNELDGPLNVSVVESVCTAINPEFGMYSDDHDDDPSSESDDSFSESASSETRYRWLIRSV